LPLPPPFFVTDGEPAVAARPLTIYTIGHSNQTADAFLALLEQHRLQILVDVRSAPYSRYAPHFNRGALAALLDDAKMHYVWADEALGGRPADPACYRDRIKRIGNVDYAAVARQTWFQDGVDRLQETAASGATAILCSEEDPRRCHRHLLIEPALRQREIAVIHIRGDGSVETIDSAHTDAAVPSPQLALEGFTP
jgi:uncharacterized protein (DUF488 family)